MKHEIPTKDWTTHVVNAIEKAVPGDTIVCHGSAMIEFGKRAAAKMCPEKDLDFIKDPGLLPRLSR